MVVASGLQKQPFCCRGCEEKQLVFTFNGTLAFIFRPRPCLFSDSRSIKGHAAAGSQRGAAGGGSQWAPNGKNLPENKYYNFTIFVSRQILSRFWFPVIAFRCVQNSSNCWKHKVFMTSQFHEFSACLYDFCFWSLHALTFSNFCMHEI